MAVRPPLATTTSTSHVASESLALLLEEDDDPQIVMLVEDEHGTEFMFSDAMPDTLSHSDTIGKIKAAIGDRDRIVVDAAGAFMHTPLPAAGAFAYLPPLPSAVGLAYPEELRPVVDLRARGPVVVAQPPELSTNKSGKISSNLIKIDNYDEIVMYNGELVTRYDRPHHCHVTTRHEVGMSVMRYDVSVTWHDENRCQSAIFHDARSAFHSFIQNSVSYKPAELLKLVLRFWSCHRK